MTQIEGQSERKASLSERFAIQIQKRIDTGEYQDRLPSIAELARESDISSVSVQKALKNLEAEGILQIRQGLGTFVASSLKPRTRAPRSVTFSESDESLNEAENPLTLEDIYGGLRLYLWTLQRRAEIAYSEAPTNSNRQQLIEFAGRLAVLDQLDDAVYEDSKNPFLMAGVVNIFKPEIAKISRYPSLGDALLDSAKAI